MYSNRTKDSHSALRSLGERELLLLAILGSDQMRGAVERELQARHNGRGLRGPGHEGRSWPSSLGLPPAYDLPLA